MVSLPICAGRLRAGNGERMEAREAGGRGDEERDEAEKKKGWVRNVDHPMSLHGDERPGTERGSKSACGLELRRLARQAGSRSFFLSTVQELANEVANERAVLLFHR